MSHLKRSRFPLQKSAYSISRTGSRHDEKCICAHHFGKLLKSKKKKELKFESEITDDAFNEALSEE